MNTMFEKEDREERQDAEVTLSTGTLLAIFFGLVVVCGVFFGFGYSMGRHSSDAKAAAAQAAAAPATPSGDSAATPTQPKPSALEELRPQTQGTPAIAPADDATSRAVVVDQPGPAASASTEPPMQAVQARQQAPATPPKPRPAPKLVAAVAQPATSPRPAPSASTQSPRPTAPAQTMVQIAAVSHAEDAEALVAALRKHGYAVSVRNEAQDKLLHVQVGPFANRAEASAMRQKLLSDGYNAIVK